MNATLFAILNPSEASATLNLHSSVHHLIDGACLVVAALLSFFVFRRTVVGADGKCCRILPLLAALFAVEGVRNVIAGFSPVGTNSEHLALDIFGTLCGVALVVSLVYWFSRNYLRRATTIESLQAEIAAERDAASLRIQEGEYLRQQVLQSSHALLSADVELRRFADLVKVSRDAILGINQDGTVWFANPAAEALFEATPGGMVGLSVSTISNREGGNLLGEIQRLDPKLPDGGQSEISITRRDGTKRSLWISISQLTKDTEGATGWGLAVRDIGERKMIEEKISHSLFEKDLLLKEVHHRVKNNLQLICSLVRLQSKETTDLTALAMFRKSEERIRTLALVHEKLYRSGSLSRIPFGGYLQDLALQLSRSCATVASSVRVESSVEDIEFPIDPAITCGLIANEVITNSIRHGAIAGQELVVRVSLKLRGGRVVLGFGDNGRGALTAERLHKATSLGLSLVRTLTAQLNGESTLRSGDGFGLEISFPDTILRVKESLPTQKVA